MYSMVLLAALTASTDMPDFGRRGGCHGCYGGCYGGYAWGGCYGGRGWGGCYGGWGGGYGGWGGCYGGYGLGWGGCYGGWGGGYGGWGMGYGGGWGYGGFVNSGLPVMGGYAGTPLLANTGTAVVAGNMMNPAASQSFYYNPGAANGANAANEATIVVHVPEGGVLTVDGRPTQSQGGTRVFHSPPLAPGRTYTYELRAEVNQDGRFHDVRKTIEVRAGQRSEVTMGFDNAGRATNRSAAPARAIEDDSAVPRRSVRTPPPVPDDQE